MKSQLLTCWWLMAIVATISTSGRESLDKVLRHVIYKAAYDVLAHHSDDTLVNTAAENNQLSGSSLDFLSSMANDVLALESGDADIVLKPPQNRAHRPEPLPEEGFVFAIDKTGRARLMMVHSLLTSSPNPVYVHMVQVSSLMQNIRERVEFQQRFVIKLDKVASHSLKGSQRILIMHDSLSMKSISVQGKAHVSRLQPKKLQWMRSPLSLRDLKFDISDLLHRKMLAASGIYSLIETFPDIVEKHKPGRVLEHATFDSFVAIPALRTAALSVQKADEVFMDAVLANIFWSGDHMIKGNIFLRDIILRGGNLVSNINGVDFQNFVLRNKVQVLGSALQIPKLFFRNWLKLNDTTNFVLDQLVFLSDHPKVINSALKMSGLSIVETSVTPFINDVEAMGMSSRWMLSRWNQHGTKLSSINQISTANIVGTKVNGLKMSKLANYLARVDRDQEMKHLKVASPRLVIQNNLNVMDSIQKVHVPRDILLTSIPQVIQSPKKFLNHLTFSEAQVDGALDGVSHLADQLVKLTDSSTTAKLFMRFGLDAFSDINVSGLIDRVNLKTLSSKAILPDSASLENALFNGLVRVRGNLVTTGLVNRIKVAEVAQDVVYGRKSESQRITSRKLVQQAMSLPIFRFEKLNSISKDSLIRTSSSELITSKIMLLNTTAMHRVTTKDSLIGGLDFVHLNESRISLSLPSIMRGVVRMSGLTSSNPVKLVGRINRFHPSDDFVNKHLAQKVSGITKFMSNSLFSGSLWTKDIAAPRIAEIDVRNLYGRRVSLSGDQSIRSRVAIEHSRCSKLSTFRLDNEEFRSFLTRLVLKDSRKVLTGPFTFTQAQFTNQLTSRNGMNRGINLARLHQSAIKSKSTLNSVSGSLVFASGFMSRTAAAKGLINDVSVNRLASESLSSRDVTGIRLKKVKFGKGFRVSGDIISQAVNHKNLRTSVLSRKHNQTIRANLIVNRLLQSKNIISRGTICGLRLRNFAASVMRTNALNHVEGNLVFREAVHVMKNVRTRTGKIKGVALRQLAQSCLPKHLDSRVLAPFRFTNRVVMNGLKTHRVNLMSLPRLLKDYALRKTNIGYSIKRPKFVNLQKAVSGFRTTGQGNVLISRNVVNGQRLNDFQNLGLPIFGSMVAVAGSKRFQNVVHSSLGIKVQGPVNRVRIPQDVLLLRSPSVQVLQGRKVFNNGVFNSLATVKGTTNGFRLPALAQDTLFKHSEQRISGRKYFKGTIQLAKMSHVKVFNGHRNISEYVTQCKTSTVQILEGRPLIRRPLLVKGKTSVSGMIGHLNLSQFLETAVFRKGKSFSRFRHPVKFGRLVLQGPVRVSGPLNGLNVEHFARDVYGHTGAVLRKSEISARMTKDHTQEANQLFKTIDSPSFGIESFKHHQNLDGVYGSLFEQQAPKLLALADIRKTGVNATVYHLRLSDTDQFMVRRVDQNVAYVQRIYFTLQDNEFALHRPSFNSMDREAYVFQGHKKLGSLGTFVDDVHVFKYSPKMVLVASLSAVQGKLRMFLVKHSKPTSPAALIQIASINVGPSATKVVSFSISGVVHIAVARSFRDLCSVADSGSLIFRFDGFSKFELIQRLSVVDSSVLAHYHNNEQHYLVFSNRDDSGYSDEPQSIHIYRAQTSSTTSCQFALFQKVKFDNINDVAVFAFGPSRSIGLYMAAVNRTTLQVWKQDGAAGFDKSWAMAATGGRALLPMLHRDNLYMLVATDSKRNCMGSLVFKAKSSGTSLSPLLLEDGTRESS